MPKTVVGAGSATVTLTGRPDAQKRIVARNINNAKMGEFNSPYMAAALVKTVTQISANA